jgi:microcystin-dependent protein
VIAWVASTVLGFQPAAKTHESVRPEDKQDDPLEQLKASFLNFKAEHIKLTERVSLLSKTIPPVGSILASGGTAIPDGWLSCDGKEYDGTESQYSALFAVIGNLYGGLKPKFKVPDLQGRMALGSGQGTGLLLRTIGEYPGQENHKLQGKELPNHTHSPHHHIWLSPGGGANIAAGGGYESAVRAASNGEYFGLPVPGSRPDRTGGYITTDDGATDVASFGTAQQAFDLAPPSCVVSYWIRYKDPA